MCVLFGIRSLSDGNEHKIKVVWKFLRLLLKQIYSTFIFCSRRAVFPKDRHETLRTSFDRMALINSLIPELFPPHNSPFRSHLSREKGQQVPVATKKDLILNPALTNYFQVTCCNLDKTNLLPYFWAEYDFLWLQVLKTKIQWFKDIFKLY
jgi:hypothetical protein